MLSDLGISSLSAQNLVRMYNWSWTVPFLSAIPAYERYPSSQYVDYIAYSRGKYSYDLSFVELHAWSRTTFVYLWCKHGSE